MIFIKIIVTFCIIGVITGQWVDRRTKSKGVSYEETKEWMIFAVISIVSFVLAMVSAVAWVWSLV